MSETKALFDDGPELSVTVEPWPEHRLSWGGSIAVEVWRLEGLRRRDVLERLHAWTAGSQKKLS